jgi:Na+/phosphate symporter
MNFVSGVINDVLEYIKQNEIEKAKQLLEEKQKQLNSSETKSNRITIDELNRSILHIDIEIKKIDIKYQLIKQNNSNVILQAIDEYLRILKKKRAEIEIEKRQVSW